MLYAYIVTNAETGKIVHYRNAVDFNTLEIDKDFWRSEGFKVKTFLYYN